MVPKEFHTLKLQGLIQKKSENFEFFFKMKMMKPFKEYVVGSDTDLYHQSGDFKTNTVIGLSDTGLSFKDNFEIMNLILD